MSEEKAPQGRSVRPAIRFAREVNVKDIALETRGQRGLPKLSDAAERDERFVYRWIRVQLDGEDDNSNILAAEADGWRFCVPEDVPDGHKLPVRSVGYCGGAVGDGDVALARLPREIMVARNKLNERKGTEMLQAVNSQLLREGDPRVPVFNDTRTIVRTGRNAEFDN